MCVDNYIICNLKMFLKIFGNGIIMFIVYDKLCGFLEILIL